MKHYFLLTTVFDDYKIIEYIGEDPNGKPYPLPEIKFIIGEDHGTFAPIPRWEFVYTNVQRTAGYYKLDLMEMQRETLERFESQFNKTLSNSTL